MMADTKARAPILAMSEKFFDAFGKLASKDRKKVNAFLSKFRKDPQSTGINYEKIANSADPNYRSARIDDSLRVVLSHPEEGNVYLLLWVGPHEDAYRWAMRHVCKINPAIGSLQIYETGEAEESTPIKSASQEPKEISVFSAFSDEDLLSVGVPQDCLDLVRAVGTREGLDVLRNKVPADAYECLVWLADGEPLESVRQAYADPEKAVGADLSELEKALQTARTQRSFRVIENDEEMRQITDASLERWRVFLHPSQKRIVEKKSLAPTLVRGGAGTGKTVVAMHRAVYLLRHGEIPQDKKILFTTFTKNLAVDLAHQIKKICTPEEFKRLEIINLDAWVAAFLKRNGVTSRIVYPGNKEYEECWKRAMTVADLSQALPESFYEEEWKRIILPQEIKTEAEYLRALRKGRGKAITRAQRKAVWPVFEEMRSELSLANFTTIEDACLTAGRMVAEQRSLVNYGAVVVDETQDLGSEALKLLANLAVQVSEESEGETKSEPSIFLVGDGQQRIYSRVASLSSCGINVRGKRSQRLKLTYRTTEEIRRAAEKILAGNSFDDMDEGKEANAGNSALRNGLPPVILKAEDFEGEISAIAKEIKALTSSASSTPYKEEDICIIVRTKELLNSYEKALKEKGVTCRRIARNQPDDMEEGGIRLATMHRVKGLEFKVVVIAGAKKGIIPLIKKYETQDKHELALEDLTERSLFYVAASRARDVLLISFHGTPSRYLNVG